VLSLISSLHLSPDVITFGCLAIGCHHLDDARELFQDMDKLGCRYGIIDLVSWFCVTTKYTYNDLF